MRICLALLFSLFLMASCAKQDPVREQQQRNLEEEIMLLKLKLQETENRLSERIRVLEMERMQQLLAAEQSEPGNSGNPQEPAEEQPANYTGPEYTPLEEAPMTASEPAPSEPEAVEPMEKPAPEPAATAATSTTSSGNSGQSSTQPAAKPKAYGDALYGVEDGAATQSYEPVASVEDTSDLPQVSVDQVRETYNQASEELKNRRYQKAGELFKAIATQHPEHRLAPNALYWLGESAYGQRDYQQAVDEFQRVLDRYPESNKAPDALLKLGKSYERLGDVTSAKESYRLVISRFPNSRAAQIAQTWL